jgi:hypothetical protein
MRKHTALLADSFVGIWNTWMDSLLVTLHRRIKDQSARVGDIGFTTELLNPPQVAEIPKACLSAAVSTIHMSLTAP